LFTIAFFACDNDTENTQEKEFTSISELITAIESGNNKFDKKEILLDTNFKFYHEFAFCLSECAGIKMLEDYDLDNTYLFQDFDLCYDNNERVIIDEEGNKIRVSNFPAYKFNEDFIDIQSYTEIINNIEIDGVVSYSKAYNFCEQTVHPSLIY
ncbi:hypothetical protein N9V96_04410, partial [Polaribacter sp.]|nr:hypothetical protein [Polaribacter sp.]